MQIFVLGAHRSGTSALTRLVNMMGAYAGSEGSTIGFNPENPKGFWERRDVIDLNEAIMAHLNCRWDDLYHWHFTTPESYTKNTLTPELHDAIKSIVLEMDHHRPWVMKDPRLCETFGFWRHHLEMPVAVIGWRDPMEVAVSLHTRNGLSMLHGLALWEHAMRCAIAASNDIPRIFISYAALMEKPYQVTQNLLKWAEESGIKGLRLPTEQEVNAFIDPTLYRSKASDAEHQSLLSAQQKALLTELMTQPTTHPLHDLSPISSDTLLLAHQHRLTQDHLHSTENFSEKQAQRIRDLEQALDIYERDSVWSVQKHEWDQLHEATEQLKQQLANTQQHLEHRIDLLGDPGRIRRRLARLLAAIA